MYEKFKLEEAKYFYGRMNEKVTNRRIFIFYLDAFLAAARSVMQFALDEAKQKQGGKAWYDSLISSSYTLGYFRDKRNFTVHSRPISPIQNVKIHVTEVVKASISATVKLLKVDEQGNVIEELKNEQNTETQNDATKTERQSPPKVEYEYRFDDWPGLEDILLLVKIHIDELENAIKDGVTKGFLLRVDENVNRNNRVPGT